MRSTRCLHKRLLINGCQLTAEPRKVVLVSTPDRGRVWQRINPNDIETQEVSP